MLTRILTIGATLPGFLMAGPRVANTTITMPGGPPASVIGLELAFPGVTFSSPLCLRSPDGDTRRLFVCEKTGDLELIPDVTATNPSKTLFLNLDSIVNSRSTETFLTSSEQGLLGVAFHPDYANNGEFFVVYNVSVGGLSHQRLSRWHDPDVNDTVADPSSEEVLIEMRNGASNHNGGDIHFGPDGYLYMSWGDEGGANDQLNNGQYLDKDFWAGVIRIDVDLEPEDYTGADGTGSDDNNLRPNSHPAVKLVGGNPLYEIPADNPWVGATTFNGVTVSPTQTRTEFFAVGLRNPWRMSFDGDDLWIADVGQNAREEITIAPPLSEAPGGTNHGWAWFEASIAGAKYNNTINGANRNSLVHTTPIYEYSHGSGAFQGRSVTGGFVYRGANIPQLTGKYVFADYVSGNIWSLEKAEGQGAPDVQRIAGEGGIVGFGPDPSNGDVLLADINNGVIRRLVAQDSDASFPDTLTETGIFSDLSTLTPNAGVVPYEVNLPFWSDHALKQRWFAIKNTTDLIGYKEDEPWTFPNGMIWVKHFDLELERGNPATRKRIETRVIVRNQTGEVTNENLIAEGAGGRYLVPSDSSLEGSWMTPSFDDSSWTLAGAGYGYDTQSTFIPEFGTNGNLGNNLNGVNTSLYVRMPFNVTDADQFSTLTLRMKYDDGFVAYLNGVQVASANAPGTLTWQSGATGNHSDSSALVFQDFSVSASLLVEGTNVLAIQGLNESIGSSDMLISPSLVGGRLDGGAEGIYGVSYRWNEAGTEATLVPSAGESFDLSITTPTGLQTQTWEIPSRASCLTCHTTKAGWALSFNTPQLNHPGILEGTSGNFLELLSSSGYLDQPPGEIAKLARHLAPSDIQYSLEARVRSYLDVNCAYCHQEGGIQPESWFGKSNLTMDETGLINGVASGGINHPDDRLIVPGNPIRSIILLRTAGAAGYSRMPPLASSEIDTEGLQLLTDWINQEATTEVNYAAWRLARFGSSKSPQGAPEFDADGDGFSNEREYLGGTGPLDPSSFPALLLQENGGNVEITFPAIGNRSVLIERSTDLSNWLPWTASGNDGLPRNPALPGPVISAPQSGPQEFFRLRVQER